MLTLDADADLAGLAASLRQLPGLIDDIRSYEVLVDAGLAEGNAQVAVIGTFDDEPGWRAYLDHPDHQAVVQQQIRPHLVARTALQATA
jgi:Stress responsive A/B Barrel Domain